MRFVDTNVLLYAVSRDAFYVQATRETRPDPLSREHAIKLVESFLRFRVQETTAGLVLAAATTARRFGVSYWDAAIRGL